MRSIPTKLGLFLVPLLCVLLASASALAGPPPTGPAPADARRARALIAAALLHYADGDGATKLDRRLAKALNRIPRARATATRLATRIRSRSSKSLAGVFGKHEAQLARATNASAIAGQLSQPVLAPGLVANANVHWLAPEKATIPKKIDFAVTGLHCTAVDDADRRDEIVVATRLVRASQGEMAVAASFDSNGTVNVKAGDTVALGDSVELNNIYDRLVVTAVSSADGSGQATQDELALAFELAFQLALQTGGDDPLHALEAALVYTEGVLALATPGGGPSFRTMRLSPADIEGLYGADTTTTGGLSHKLAFSHTLGKGHYDVLVNVPAKTLVKPTIRILVENVRSLDDEIPINGHMRLYVTIGSQTHSQVLPLGKSNVKLAHDVRRKMASDKPVDLRLKLTWTSPAPKWSSWTKEASGKKTTNPNSWLPKTKKYYCGTPPSQVKKGLEDNGYKYTGACKAPGDTLDLGPNGAALELRYDPKSDTLSQGGKTIKAKRGAFTTVGTGNSRASIRFTVSRLRRMTARAMHSRHRRVSHRRSADYCQGVKTHRCFSLAISIATFCGLFCAAQTAEARSKKAKYVISVQFVRTADDDGSNPSTLTKAQAQAAVENASETYMNAGGDVRFVLHPDSNFDSVIKNTTLNRDCPLQPGQTKASIEANTNPDLDGDGEPATKADRQILCDYDSTFLARSAYALERADRIVVFPRGHRERVYWSDSKGHWEIRNGPGGSASPDGFYVNMPSGKPPVHLLAHELGHYFHVWHTFGSEPKSVAQAATSITSWAAANPGAHPRETFNGDTRTDTYRVYDTPADPGEKLFLAVHGTKCGTSSAQATVKVPAKVNGKVQQVTLTPDRTNVMSYFHCKKMKNRLSEDQWEHIHAALESGNRQGLVDKSTKKSTCYASDGDSVKGSVTKENMLALIRKLSQCLKLQKQELPWETVVNGSIYINPSEISTGFSRIGGLGVHRARERKMLNVLLDAQFEP